MGIEKRNMITLFSRAAKAHTIKWASKQGFLQTCACTDYREAEKLIETRGIKNKKYIYVFLERFIFILSQHKRKLW